VARLPEEHALVLESGSCSVISAWVGKQLAAYFVIGKGKDLQNYIHEWAGATQSQRDAGFLANAALVLGHGFGID